MNKKKQTGGITPLKGVSFDPKVGGGATGTAWRVRTYYGGKEKTIGRFPSVAEANAALLAYRETWDALMVVCDPYSRCVGCQGVRLRSAEAWLTA